jgi:hypothetical protein
LAMAKVAKAITHSAAESHRTIRIRLRIVALSTLRSEVRTAEN